MTTKGALWWVKSPKEPTPKPELSLDLSTSLVDYLENEQNLASTGRENNNETDVDVGSIIEEINKVAAQSPLGPYQTRNEERSVEDLLQEAERIYIESSKSFDQLSQISKTSQNVTELQSSSSQGLNTPKSVSPLPLDRQKESESDTYSSDFIESDTDTDMSPSNLKNKQINNEGGDIISALNSRRFSESVYSSPRHSQSLNKLSEIQQTPKHSQSLNKISNYSQYGSVKMNNMNEKNDDEIKSNSASDATEDLRTASSVSVEAVGSVKGKTDEKVISPPVEGTGVVQPDLSHLTPRVQPKQVYEPIDSSRQLKSPDESAIKLQKCEQDLKESEEKNTALHLQLTELNKTHKFLKHSYEDLVSSNKNLERKVIELDTLLNKYQTELNKIQDNKEEIFRENKDLKRMLENETLQCKSLKIQNEKDAKCIQDLNRQIKEMERIIARKHPDSVSALIVAAKNDTIEQTPTTRRVLEDRIKILEEEAHARDRQSSKVFVDIQEKFNQMKAKYESHIDDLELHVSDLKHQLKKKIDTYDVYTQTVHEEQKIPSKCSSTISVQTEPVKQLGKPTTKPVVKEETHLLVTIRGLQVDLSNKEKTITKLKHEIDELQKTNRKLQKEREGALKNYRNNRKEFRSYPDKLAAQVKSNNSSIEDVHSNKDDLTMANSERNKLREQLFILEQDYQNLKTKRLHDLNILQEAHEREMSMYVSNINNLKEQIEVQQVSITTIQNQLSSTQQELIATSVEKDYLKEQLANTSNKSPQNVTYTKYNDEIQALQKQIAYLEKRYEEREHRLRAIVQGLAQKSMSSVNCDKCSERQNQLLEYKAELDQLLVTLRSLQ